jgi:8-oxo-dGTP pyrophosphatase MutT (NUDIX family)
MVVSRQGVAACLKLRYRHYRLSRVSTVLLMTSRDTGRWIVPKGNIKPGVTPCKAAEQEAYEEAGVKGTIISSNPLGMYTYVKKLASGEARVATVEVYLLRVKERLKRWPERSERKLSWVSTKEAIRLVEEPGVVPLLLQLMEFEHDLADPPREPLSEFSDQGNRARGGRPPTRSG